jgi:predicted HTH transcriptional regulator
LRGRFGQDVELDSDHDSNFAVQRTITGNLWSQLDTLIDLLALINFQFRLKAEVSRTVSVYNAIAVKEMIVNAIVHRDYDLNEPVQVIVEPKSITVISPGGLIDEITAQLGDRPFQEAITRRTSPIKGYRNPAISDLFYGGGQMDRRGSGLADMVLATVNNNGSVAFGPSTDNRQFHRNNRSEAGGYRRNHEHRLASRRRDDSVLVESDPNRSDAKGRLAYRNDR